MHARIVYLALVLMVMGCSEDEKSPDSNSAKQLNVSTLVIPASMKGYEVYSWPDNGKWKFTLITGTNRLKTYSEITATENKVDDSWIKVTVEGADAFKQLIQKIPQEQFVVWIANPSMVPGFSLPSSLVVNEIKDICQGRNVVLGFNE